MKRVVASVVLVLLAVCVGTWRGVLPKPLKTPPTLNRWTADASRPGEWVTQPYEGHEDSTVAYGRVTWHAVNFGFAETNWDRLCVRGHEEWEEHSHTAMIGHSMMRVSDPPTKRWVCDTWEGAGLGRTGRR